MAINYTYPVKGQPVIEDEFLIVDTQDGNATKRVTVDSILDLGSGGDIGVSTFQATDGTFIKIINKYSRLYDNTDGIFGYNFFNKRIWKLDYNKCEIYMSPKISSKYKILKINGKQNKYVTLTINNKKYNFIIDIGPSFINKKDKPWNNTIILFNRASLLPLT